MSDGGEGGVWDGDVWCVRRGGELGGGGCECVNGVRWKVVGYGGRDG